MLPTCFLDLIYAMIDTNIIGGFLFGAVLVVVIIGTAISEAHDRKKNDRLEEE